MKAKPTLGFYVPRRGAARLARDDGDDDGEGGKAGFEKKLFSAAGTPAAYAEAPPHTTLRGPADERRFVRGAPFGGTAWCGIDEKRDRDSLRGR